MRPVIAEGRRYLRMPAGLVHELGLPAHRAMPDAYVTAHHLRDMLNETSLHQLLAWSAEPGPLPRVPVGPDRGKSWELASLNGVRELAVDRDVDVRFTAETELRRRGEIELETPTAEPAQASFL